MKFANAKVGVRLGFAFSLILLITLVIAGMGVWRLQELADTTRQLTTVDNDRLRAAIKWHDAVEQNWLRTQTALLDSDIGNLPSWKEDIRKTVEATDIARKTLVDLVSGEGAELLKQVDTAREAYRKVRETLLSQHSAGQDVSDPVERELRPLAEAYIGAIDRMEERQLMLYERTRDEAEQKATQGRRIVIAATIVALLLGIVLSYLLTRSITGPLQLAAQRAGQIAEGDLTQPIDADGKDEAARLLQALQHMQSNLSQLVSGVRANAESVAIASTEISEGNNNLSVRTEQQASALEETAASMEELGSTVRQNADNARQANHLAMNASSVAVEGGQVVAEVVDTMKGINDSSRKIADIIGVIDGIAFQTNILALNAAVEAARAGEQGRGFAVVAGEVRSLAQRSAEAAKEIKALITASVERVEQGTLLVDKAGATMTEVVTAIRRVTDIMGEISAASSEQSAGVSQVGEAITQMDHATQQNAALVEESAAAADSLKTQAAQLVQAVAVFRISQEHEQRSQALPLRKPASLAAESHRAPPARTAPASLTQRNSQGTAVPVSPVMASVQRNKDRNAAADAHDHWESF
ncbi:HAMP domain-containing protein [Diaphorobacter ruginosibacter]|uniref:HAMP domain-containing protein n=1 Tax=Diaphorobacter ruginosibacter TaxID=1715720 RepID=A0A7G9RPW5_9BURK|nr:methyl-accepting chemotaxis protein [Diaphorobacter ruginosibacter]QNN57640.1 HAMP domain-containing protein [Diaphorobacter ruginosibacter]